MVFDFWDIFRVAMTFGGDLILVLTLISSVIILIGALISIAADNHRRPAWSQRWDAFVLGFIASLIGLIAKWNDTSGLPIGVIFQFSFAIAIFVLGLSLIIVVVAITLPLVRRHTY